MNQDNSVMNLQRTRKFMCLKAMGSESPKPEEKLKKFDELLRQLGNQLVHYENNRGRKTRSEYSLIGAPHHLRTSYDEEFVVTEILPGDAKQLYFNENDARSEEFVL